MGIFVIGQPLFSDFRSCIIQTLTVIGMRRRLSASSGYADARIFRPPAQPERASSGWRGPPRTGQSPGEAALPRGLGANRKSGLMKMTFCAHGVGCLTGLNSRRGWQVLGASPWLSQSEFCRDAPGERRHPLLVRAAQWPSGQACGSAQTPRTRQNWWNSLDSN